MSTRIRTVIRTTMVSAAVAAMVAAGGGTAVAGVSDGPSFWVDGTGYRTVGTPTDLAGTGAPDHSFDTIYDLGGAQMNIATAAPGDTDYSGGRWMVHGVEFPNGYEAAIESGDLDDDGVLDSDAELQAAMDAGDATDVGVVKQFVCPVIPLPRGRS